MRDEALWKYCTPRHCREFLLSLNLLGNTAWPEEKQISCLYAVANHVEKHYRPLTVRKRDGGIRRLKAPDPLLKTIQQNLLHRVLETQPVSASATAYRPGSGVVKNALPHLHHRQLLKLDIQDFFSSITFLQVKERAFSDALFPPQVGTLFTRLCCYEDYLPQGAPTSAAISNLVLLPFDREMERWCGERGIAYSRYCDDLAFSGEFDARQVENKASSFLEVMGFTLNRKKTKLLSHHVRQAVTGVVVNEKPQVSRDYRKKLRQELYYCEKYGVASHLERLTGRPAEQGALTGYLSSLLGKINFVLLVNPQDNWFREAAEQVKCWNRQLKQA